MYLNAKTNHPAATPVPDPVAWIGLDWGHKTHAFALQERARPQEEGTLTQSSEHLHQWLDGLAKRFNSQPVSLAIEASRGAVILALLEYPWLTIYPINPVTSARYRQAFTPSRASDDLPDARVLLELVRDHAAKLRPLAVPDPQTVKLGGLVELRRRFVDQRTKVLQQLIDLLRGYYPQALELVEDLNTNLAVDFLSRWPDVISLKAARPATLRQWYYNHNLRRPELLDERLKLVEKAVPLTRDEARLSVAVLQLGGLLDQLRALRKHVAVLDREIKSAFAAHPEAYLFRDLPGAGAALAPRLCALFGTDRTVYETPASLQQVLGVAPVLEKSGQRGWVHWRWAAPAFLRQSIVEWAGQTVMYSAWARVYYDRMKAKGKGHWMILRALAFKWLRVLWKCWQSRTPYDEIRYQKQLSHRRSPNALPA
jgi:transposase